MYADPVSWFESCLGFRGGGGGASTSKEQAQAQV